MHALHVIPSIAPRYGGPSSAVVGMSNALQHAGVAVQIATTDADGPTRLRVPHGTSVEWAGVPTVFFPRQWSESFKYSRPLAGWLTDHVAGFDVVHIHAVFSHACLAAASACRRRRVPYIVRPLGTLDPWSLQQKTVKKQVLWHFGVRSMLNRSGRHPLHDALGEASGRDCTPVAARGRGSTRRGRVAFRSERCHAASRRTC